MSNKNQFKRKELDVKKPEQKQTRGHTQTQTYTALLNGKKKAMVQHIFPV